MQASNSAGAKASAKGDQMTLLVPSGKVSAHGPVSEICRTKVVVVVPGPPVRLSSAVRDATLPRRCRAADVPRGCDSPRRLLKPAHQSGHLDTTIVTPLRRNLADIALGPLCSMRPGARLV